MDTNSVEKKNSSVSGLNLERSYNWLEKTYTDSLQETIQEFWETGLDIKLINISENSNFFFIGSEYFVTRVKIGKNDQCIIRISAETAQIFLDSVLGYRNDFKLENLTELEAKILTAFNNLIYTNLSENFYDSEDIEMLEQENNVVEGECNFTFYIKDLSELPAKILISVPSKYIKYAEVPNTNYVFGISDFPNAKVNVNLFLGSTTIPLNDVKNIECEDIIVLENSNINTMTLNFEGNEFDFKISPDPSLIVSFNNNEGNKNMSNETNIWDNIQVDISAEFENVKITLGEIKRISEGLVLDIGSLYENKVYLKVENKTIAEGELVIINDRYGVKIDKIVNGDSSQNTKVSDDEIKETSVQDIQEKTPDEENNSDKEIENEEKLDEEQEDEENSDEFDYKDFDVEDENI